MAAIATDNRDDARDPDAPRWSHAEIALLRRAGEIVRLLRGRGSTLVVTHDRRFITPDDIVLEIEDGRLSSRPGVAPPVAASS